MRHLQIAVLNRCQIVKLFVIIVNQLSQANLCKFQKFNLPNIFIQTQALFSILIFSIENLSKYRIHFNMDDVDLKAADVGFSMDDIDLNAATWYVWLVGCTAALICLVRPIWAPTLRCDSINLTNLYVVYFLSHIAFSILNLQPDEEYQKMATALLPIPAGIYFVVGHILLYSRQDAFMRSGPAKLLTCVAIASVVAVAVAYAIPHETARAFTFLIYLVCACYAYAGVVVVYVREREGPAATVGLVLLLGGTIGMIDFLLPALPEVGLMEKWKYMEFVTRLADVVCYLPAAVYAMRELDCIPAYRGEVFRLQTSEGPPIVNSVAMH